MKKIYGILAVAGLASSLVLAGCGGSGGSTNSALFTPSGFAANERLTNQQANGTGANTFTTGSANNTLGTKGNGQIPNGDQTVNAFGFAASMGTADIITALSAEYRSTLVAVAGRAILSRTQNSVEYFYYLTNPAAADAEANRVIVYSRLASGNAMDGQFGNGDPGAR